MTGWSKLGGTLPPALYFLGRVVCAGDGKVAREGIERNAIAKQTILRGAEVFGMGCFFACRNCAGLSVVAAACASVPANTAHELMEAEMFRTSERTDPSRHTDSPAQIPAREKATHPKTSAPRKIVCFAMALRSIPFCATFAPAQTTRPPKK